MNEKRFKVPTFLLEHIDSIWKNYSLSKPHDEIE